MTWGHLALFVKRVVCRLSQRVEDFHIIMMHGMTNDACVTNG